RGVGGALRRGARALLGGLAGDRADDGAGVAATQQARHGAQQEGAFAERLSLEAGSGEHLAALGERRGVCRRQLDRLGDEERVAGDGAARVLLAEPLEGHALVRRMLVDEHHPAVSLADEIALEDLPDEAQRRKSAGRRAPQRQRRRRGRPVLECQTRPVARPVIIRCRPHPLRGGSRLGPEGHREPRAQRGHDQLGHHGRLPEANLALCRVHVHVRLAGREAHEEHRHRGPAALAPAGRGRASAAWARSVAGVRRNFRRAGVAAKRPSTSTDVPGGAPGTPAARAPPASASTTLAPGSPARRVVTRTRATAAMLGSASPRKPSVVTQASSSARASLLVAWRAKARSASAAVIPSPSSRTAMRSRPPPARRTSMLRAPASSAFSTSSFTTEAGRSMTSPAAICAWTSGGRTAILLTARG